jgi:O-Methyltransferase involved in polyketide biosynthesis
MISDLIQKGSISETLFIPLSAKAKETKDPKGVIKDPKAVEIIEKSNLALSQFDGGNITHVGIIARTEVMDKGVIEFLNKHKNGLIINIGAGLDTRITRVDNEQLRWFDIDMPEVIEARKLFFEENERIKFIGKNVLNASWLDEIPYEEKEPVLIIAEGILMYFHEEELKRLFELLISKFHGADMYFDVVHSFFVGQGVSAKFIWGIKKAKDIEAINPGIELIESWSTGNLLKKRQDMYFRIMNFMSGVRNRSQILHVFLKSKKG